MGRHDGRDGAMFDAWLHNSLSDAYGATLTEPLPRELESILATLPELEHEG
jgi:hypothetical protein